MQHSSSKASLVQVSQNNSGALGVSGEEIQSQNFNIYSINEVMIQTVSIRE